MAKENKTKIYNTSIFNDEPVFNVDWSNSIREDFHLEFDGNHSVKVVSDGLTDYQEMIESKKNDAGLVNIIRLNELRYGTVQNAIVANEQKKLYADVSQLPDGVGEQAALVAETNAAIEKLCQELGLTKEQIINLTPEQYIKIKQDQAAAASASSAGQGGAE